MNRVEFMAELERLLADLPEDERQAAVQYYADYFADAGAENEAEVIRELGSPEKTAESIKADYYGRTFDESRFEHKDYMEKYGQQASGQQTSGQQPAGTADSPAGEQKKPWTSRGLKSLLIVLIAIVVWPLSLGLICAVLGILAAVVCLFAGLVIAAVCVMIADEDGMEPEIRQGLDEVDAEPFEEEEEPPRKKGGKQQKDKDQNARKENAQARAKPRQRRDIVSRTYVYAPCNVSI